ncbi:MAG: hypothetical protein M3R22_10405, partial [Pseudomonadota bacterium]|nr:hypothetical protein [Pseudomonadota bacterium]
KLIGGSFRVGVSKLLVQRAIKATGAERVVVTHGYEAVMVRWLTEQGLEASAFETEYGDNDDDAPGDASGEATGDVSAVVSPDEPSGDDAA